MCNVCLVFWVYGCVYMCVCVCVCLCLCLCVPVCVCVCVCDLLKPKLKCPRFQFYKTITELLQSFFQTFPPEYFMHLGDYVQKWYYYYYYYYYYLSIFVSHFAIIIPLTLYTGQPVTAWTSTMVSSISLTYASFDCLIFTVMRNVVGITEFLCISEILI